MKPRSPEWVCSIPAKPERLPYADGVGRKLALSDATLASSGFPEPHPNPSTSGPWSLFS